MEFIIEAIDEWIKLTLITGIMGNIEGMFDYVNGQVGAIAGEVGRTPSQWNGSVFSMIENLSNTVIMPIAGIILTFVMCYELITMIIDKNNMNDFTPADIFKWIMKTYIAIIIVTNTFPIIMGVFEIAQQVIASASGVITSNTEVGINSLSNFESSLSVMDIGVLLGIFIQIAIVRIGMWILGTCVFVIVYGRMIEIYLMISLGPIPLSTMGNHEWGSIGQNYIKAIMALAFQGFLIMICIAIYAVLVQSITTSSDPIGTMWQCIGYTALLCFSLFKTGSLSKSVFSAH